MSCIFYCVFTLIYILQPLCWKARLTSRWPHDSSRSEQKENRQDIQTKCLITNLFTLILASLCWSWVNFFVIVFLASPTLFLVCLINPSLFAQTVSIDAVEGKELELFPLAKVVDFVESFSLLKRASLKGEEKSQIQPSPYSSSSYHLHHILMQDAALTDDQWSGITWFVSGPLSSLSNWQREKWKGGGGGGVGARTCKPHIFI